MPEDALYSVSFNKAVLKCGFISLAEINEDFAIFIYNELHFNNCAIVSSCFYVQEFRTAYHSIPEAINIYLTAACGYLV